MPSSETSPDLANRPQPTRRGQRVSLWWVLLLVAAIAYAARLLPTVRGGGLRGLQGYDGSVYYAAAAGLANGLLPYRDFLLLHPPGITLVLLPFGLLGRLIGHGDALVVARLAWIALGALSAVLVSQILAQYGRTAALLAGLVYAVYVPALTVEHSTTLEAVASACLLGAMLALSRSTVRRGGSALPFVLAGLLLGLSTGVKIWGVLILAAVLVWCLATFGRRLAGWLVAGAALGVTLVCLPFFLAAPSAMWRMVVLDQLGRSRVSVPWFERLRDMAGLSEIEVVGNRVVLAGVVAVMAVLVLGAALVLAWRTRPGRLAVLVFAASGLVLLASPSWSVDYASLGGPSLAVLLGAGVAGLFDLVRPRWLLLALVVAMLLSLAGYTVKSLQHLQFGAPFPGPELRAALAPAPGCVTSDDPAALVLTDVLQRNIDRGCPLVVDLGGYSYDLRPAADQQVARSRNAQWQEFTLDYLASGRTTMIVRFRDIVGFSRETRTVIAGWPEVTRAGDHTVQRPEAPTAAE